VWFNSYLGRVCNVGLNLVCQALVVISSNVLFYIHGLEVILDLNWMLLTSIVSVFGVGIICLSDASLKPRFGSYLQYIQTLRNLP
jgi:hypothetical protein